MSVASWADSFPELRVLHWAVHAASYGCASNSEDLRAERIAWRDLAEAQRRVKAGFAAERGWQPGKHFSLPRLASGMAGRSRGDMEWRAGQDVALDTLAWDHPDFFRERCRPYRPAAAVVHVYCLRPDPAHTHADALAALHGLVFEPLPWSWYYPGGCLAGLYRRPSEAERARPDIWRRPPTLRLVKGGA